MISTIQTGKYQREKYAGGGYEDVNLDDKGKESP